MTAHWEVTIIEGPAKGALIGSLADSLEGRESCVPMRFAIMKQGRFQYEDALVQIVSIGMCTDGKVMRIGLRRVTPEPIACPNMREYDVVEEYYYDPLYRTGHRCIVTT
ncbi:MAG: hypothetical protein Q4B06_02290 [Candidatus Saccharibacteria bacterium]|nr:hypothetical protein [Candidatus Saccharibacteria bacterium]